MSVIWVHLCLRTMNNENIWPQDLQNGLVLFSAFSIYQDKPMWDDWKVKIRNPNYLGTTSEIIQHKRRNIKALFVFSNIWEMYLGHITQAESDWRMCRCCKSTFHLLSAEVCRQVKMDHTAEITVMSGSEQVKFLMIKTFFYIHALVRMIYHFGDRLISLNYWY